MNKSILVINTPNRCGECPVCASYKSCAFSTREVWCATNGKDVELDSKPDWCPLRPLPKREESFDCEELCDVEDWYDSGYANGWNACIEEISGG